jgi:peptidoglycan-associated lipoprotein
MNILSKTAAILALLAAAACTNNNSYDDTSFGGAGAGAGTSAGGAPGSASDPTSQAYFQQAVGDRVLFAVDQSTLSDEARTLLKAQAAWLSSNPEYTAVIEGHADEQGTREYNLALGARRADAVREFLIANGVAGNRLQVVSFGKERPLEICSEESCYAKNRRAVTVLALGLTG